MNSESKYYKLSGHPDFMIVVVSVLFGVLIAIPTSILYALVSTKLPFPYLNFIFSFIYAFIVGIAYKSTEKKGNNRNYLVSLISSLIMGGLGYYISWVALLTFIEAPPGFNKIVDKYIFLIQNPQEVINKVSFIIKEGWFKIGNEIVKGNGYITLLVLEGLVYLFIFGIICPLNKNDIYCENCGRWLEEEEYPVMINPDILSELKISKSTGKIDNWIEELKITDKFPYIYFTVCQCKNCKNLNLLSAVLIKWENINKGEEGEEIDIDEIFRNLIIRKEEMEKLIEKLENLKKESKEMIENL